MPAVFDETRVDQKVDVSTDEATKMARILAREEGIMGGMSSGGACHIALKVASEINKGMIVFIVCDRGDRYLSSDLYE